MEETVKTTITDIVAQTAVALQEAVTEYGPEAVELGLLVFQIEAIYTLMLSTIPFILLLNLIWTVPWAMKITKKQSWYDDPYQWMLVTMSNMVIGMFTVIGLIYLTNPFLWLAAFGNPEAMIAKNALKAAGLM